MNVAAVSWAGPLMRWAKFEIVWPIRGEGGGARRRRLTGEGVTCGAWDQATNFYCTNLERKNELHEGKCRSISSIGCCPGEKMKGTCKRYETGDSPGSTSDLDSGGRKALKPLIRSGWPSNNVETRCTTCCNKNAKSAKIAILR
jgi:hypothetical protein